MGDPRQPIIVSARDNARRRLAKNPDYTQNGFAMNYCCAELEKLSHPQSGLGLMRVTNKRGTRFFLLYQKDWHVPVAEDGIQIHFCPFCGSKLIWPPLEEKVGS